MYYINNFFLYSIFGHIIETVFYTLGSGESGILYGYWTPIYGIGCTFIIFCYEKIFKEKKKSKIIECITIFLIGAVGLSILEYIGGVLIETFFDVVFWDYSNLRFNIGKYTSLEMAIIWGIASIGLIYLVKPVFDYFNKKIPKFFTWILIILFLIDIICVIVSKLF